MDDIDLIKTIRLLCKDLLIKDSIDKIITKIGRDFSLIKPPSIFKRGYNRFIKRRKTDLYSLVLKRILRLREITREILGVPKKDGRIEFILRVDDFPRWEIPTRMYRRFHEILRGNNIPYLLGVTPFVSLNPLDPRSRRYRPLSDEERILLKEMGSDGVEFALHGFTHQIRTKRLRSELIGLSNEELDKNIQRGLEELSTIFFIPPFNRIDLANYRILSKYFRVICSGREAIRYLGFRITPSYLSSTLYISSYEPCYGHAKEVLEYLDSIYTLEDNIIIPITIHWAWEIYNGFKSVELLATKITGRTIKWSSLIETN